MSNSNVDIVIVKKNIPQDEQTTKKDMRLQLLTLLYEKENYLFEIVKTHKLRFEKDKQMLENQLSSQYLKSWYYLKLDINPIDKKIHVFIHSKKSRFGYLNCFNCNCIMLQKKFNPDKCLCVCKNAAYCSSFCLQDDIKKHSSYCKKISSSAEWIPNVIPLADSVIAGDIIDVKEILQNNQAVINITDMFGRTALYYAIKGNNIKMVQTLLKYNADPNYIAYGKTAICDCIVGLKSEILNLLLQSGKVTVLNKRCLIKGEKLTCLNYYYKFILPNQLTLKNKNAIKKILELLRSHGAIC